MTARASFYGLILLLALLPSRPALALLPYLASETAVPVEQGKSRLDVSLSDERWRRTLSTFALTTELSSGLLNNLDFSVDVSYRFRKERQDSDEDGLGDLKLKAKVRFIKGREANPVSIAGQLTVKFPSCNEDKRLSHECTGEADVGVRAIASKEFFPMMVHLNLGYIFVGNPPPENLDGVLTDRSLDDVLSYSVAFDYLVVADYFHVVGELAGETNRDPNASADPLSALVGLLLDLDRGKVLSLTGSHALTGPSPNYGGSIGFRYLF
ncbi:MAG: hypothetical protein AABY46_08425 [Nitrospirota bacterium]